jgi:hypothetical protein
VTNNKYSDQEQEESKSITRIVLDDRFGQEAMILAIEAFTAARVACYPAIMAMKRSLGNADEDDSNNDSDNMNSDGNAKKSVETPLPKYEIDSSSESGLS